MFTMILIADVGAKAKRHSASASAFADGPIGFNKIIINKKKKIPPIFDISMI